ncbi:hypothetical protein PIROE2DRAFT_2536 [Piromyces sp. E2]|nr:hypothetical protein PIROE2DRAFT_2536 [Piromyces sp. E2]|eukprot:OUM69450.1 hypothetical protein PIROE2DRAFT_2536 [Piromyces sp. E2]
MENVYGENLYGDNGIAAFTLMHRGIIELRNIELHNVTGSSYGGVLFHSMNEVEGATFKVNNGIFTDFYQFFEKRSATFTWITKNVNMTIENPSKVIFKNVTVDGFYSKEPAILINGESFSDTTLNIVEIYNFVIKNVSSIDSMDKQY